MIAPRKITEIKEIGHVAVILASSIGAIELIRALGKEKVPVIVIGQNYHHKSIYTTVALKAETKKDVENLLFLIPRLLDMKPVLFTDGDDYLEIIYSNLSQLETSYFIPVSKNNFNLINKEYIEKIKDINNIATLPITIKKISDIEKEHYPIIIKPLAHGSSFSGLKNRPEKAYICDDHVQVEATDKYLGELNISYVAQQMIVGEANTIFTVLLYRNATGKIIVGYTMKKLRVYPLEFGVASAVALEGNNEIINQSIAIMECTDYQGIAEFEYKLCEKTNKYFLIEVNGRFPLQTSLLKKSNPHFIYTVFLDLMKIPAKDAVSIKSVSNVIWIFSLNDIRAIKAEFKESKLKINIKMCFSSRIQSALWSISDPLPTIYFLKYVAYKLYRNRHDKNHYSKMKSRGEKVL